ERNRTHRLAVLVYAGLAIAWVLSASEFEKAMFTAGPLALTLFALLGLRHLFSLPADLRANWIFQITEREVRLAWLNAGERFVLGCAVAPIIAIGAVFIARTRGPLIAVAWAVLAFLLSAIAFEYLFRNWRKLPFTCSYLPGKRPMVWKAALFLGLMPLLAP